MGAKLKKEPKKAEVILEYQPVVAGPPMTSSQLYQSACSSDKVTITSWADTWIKNIKANKAKFGSFTEKSAGKLFGRYQYQPGIIAGAGPSLKRNGHQLAKRGGMPLVSCLHNFHFFEDRGINVDYYLTLDAGPVTIEEVYEGGEKDQAHYWEQTKGKKLVAFIGANAELLEKWQGEVYFFNAPVPDEDYMKRCMEIEHFDMMFSNGGNVLGSCLYFAKAILGCNPIVYVGADFSFGYDHKFHAWDSKYDKTLGNTVKATDLYGNSVHTWQSYFNFKNFFEYVAMSVPGVYINATEGGVLGAYPGGNIEQIKYMDLDDVFEMYHINDHIKPQCDDPSKEHKFILY